MVKLLITPTQSDEQVYGRANQEEGAEVWIVEHGNAVSTLAVCNNDGASIVALHATRRPVSCNVDQQIGSDTGAADVAMFQKGFAQERHG